MQWNAEGICTILGRLRFRNPGRRTIQHFLQNDRGATAQTLESAHQLVSACTSKLTELTSPPGEANVSSRFHLPTVTNFHTCFLFSLTDTAAGV